MGSAWTGCRLPLLPASQVHPERNRNRVHDEHDADEQERDPEGKLVRERLAPASRSRRGGATAPSSGRRRSAGGTGRKNAAPVNMMGAVSPAVRDTSRMTPVRMPLTAFGKTMRAESSATGSRPCSSTLRGTRVGTAWRDSRVATITTGRVMIAKRQARRENARAETEEQDEGTDPEERVHDRRHARQVDDGEIDETGEPIVGRVLAEIDRGRDA